jgi:hypothetical protein
MGGQKAEMNSHLSVTLDLMRGLWVAELPDWQKGRAIGCLLEQLVRSRPDDWKAVLYLIDTQLGNLVARGDPLSRRARAYLADWIRGHFYDLEGIRSFANVATELRAQRLPKPARKLRRTRKHSD